jgi:hypothetical protein
MKETPRQFNHRIRNRFNDLKQANEIRFVGYQRGVMYHCDKRKTGGRRKVFKAFISSNDFRVWQQIVSENRSLGWLFWEGKEDVYGGKQYGMVKHEKE